MKKLLILVDEANLIGVSKAVNKRINWEMMRDKLVSECPDHELIEMIVYVGLPPQLPRWEDKRNKIEKFLRWLTWKGFMVIRKYGYPQDENTYKANVDVIMGIDAVSLSQNMKPDTVILISGDSDFVYLCETLRRSGVNVKIASINSMLSEGLKSSANGFINLESVMKDFEQLSSEESYENMLMEESIA